MTRCVHKNKNGERCGSQSLKDSPDGKCFFHSKKTKEKRMLASKKGGSVCQGDLRKAITINSPMDVLRLLEAVINGVKIGKLEPRVANSLFYGINISLKAIELYKLDVKLDELLKMTEQQKGWRGQFQAQDMDCLDPEILAELDEEERLLSLKNESKAVEIRKK